jgi:hypothetical protein
VFNILPVRTKRQHRCGEFLKVEQVAAQVGCAIGAVHHFNKNSEGSLTQRLRGAGAIAG